MTFRNDDVAQQLGVSRQTWRNWRASIPAVQHRRGARAKFTSGEMLALHVIRHLVRDYGISIGCVAQRCDQIFQASRYDNWARVRESILVYSLRTGDAELVPTSESRHADRFVGSFVVPISVLLQQLETAIHYDYVPAELGAESVA